SEWKAGNAVNQATWVLILSEDALQQLRSGVSDLRLIAHISRSSHQHAEPDNSRHFVERSQMFPCDREGIQRRKMRRFASRFHIELGADAPDEFRHAAFRREHAGEKKQITCLDCFRINAKRFRRSREFDAEFFQTRLGAGRIGICACYHLPTCAPPSTCSTSPVMWRASVR